jgi:hypothetical protein
MKMRQSMAQILDCQIQKIELKLRQSEEFETMLSTERKRFEEHRKQIVIERQKIESATLPVSF